MNKKQQTKQTLFRNTVHKPTNQPSNKQCKKNKNENEKQKQRKHFLPFAALHEVKNYYTNTKQKRQKPK